LSNVEMTDYCFEVAQAQSEATAHGHKRRVDHKVNGQPLTTARNLFILMVHPARLERATP